MNNRFIVPTTDLEETRIRSAYARRQRDDLRYSWFSPAYLFFIQERERQVLKILKHNGFLKLKSKRILEIGCGTGDWLRDLIKWGAKPENLTGIDLLPASIGEARRLCPQGVELHCGNAASLQFKDSTFDLVLQSTAFTSILDTNVKKQVASEMIRMLARNGLILWYDYHVNNPWNPDVRGVNKREIYRLFPGCQIKLRRITLAPPLARGIVPCSWFLAYLLERIPPLCTHYIGVIRKA